MTTPLPTLTREAHADGVIARVHTDLVRVDFVDLNEGFDGDYRADDPNDTRLLRLDVAVRDTVDVDAEEIGDGWSIPSSGSSTCTLVPHSADEDERWRLLEFAATWLHHAVQTNSSLKRTMERLSYLPSDLFSTSALEP